jgi:TonB family protein
MSLRVVIFLFITLLASAAETPKRIDSAVAEQNALKKVEPIVPPLAKLMGIGGVVTLEIEITATGNVANVKLLNGHPMLAPAFIDAVKKWQYKPFQVDGRAVPVLTTVEWKVSSPQRTASEKKALDDYYPMFDNCYKLFNSSQLTEAERACAEAVAISDKLPQERQLERSDARNFLGNVFLQEHRLKDAIPLYEKAVEIGEKQQGSDSDADFAAENVNLGYAYFLNGELEKADSQYALSISIYRAAIKSLPEMKSNYQSRLKRALIGYASVKEAEGKSDDAKQLEDSAAAID